VAFTYPQLKPRVKMSRAIPPYFYTAFGSVWLYLYPHYWQSTALFQQACGARRSGSGVWRGSV